MAQPEVADVDPAGDVVFICGDTSKPIVGSTVCLANTTTTPGNTLPACSRVRVSSAIMSYASPVFKAMLNKKFQEGSNLATSSTVEISLPDENPQDMLIICHVLHMHHWVAPIPTSVQQIIQLGRICDKYDCTEAVVASAGQWITERLRLAGDVERGQLLYAACLFDDEPTINRVAVDVIMHSKPSGLIASSPKESLWSHAASETFCGQNMC